MRKLIAAVLLAVSPVAASATPSQATQAEAQAPRISPGAARLLIQRGAFLLDVREPHELAAEGWLAGAVNLPMSRLKPMIAAGEMPAVPRDRPIVLYCGSGARAGVAAQMLGKNGYRQLYNLGGFKDASAVLPTAGRRGD